MKNPLDSVPITMALGVIFAIIIMALPAAGTGDFSQMLLGRWLHIVAGVFWIGLLYYFNVAQIPALGAAAADKGGPGSAGIVKYVAPRALFWFRWAALVTWLTGAWVLGNRFMPAFTLAEGSVVIGIGVWLGTIMLLNVWGIIWPNQKRVIGVVPATDAEKAVARRRATLASRVNFLLSFPMLLCMGGRVARPAAARNAVLMTLPANLREQVAAALREDVGPGDVTAGLVPSGQRVHGHVLARLEAAVLCGTAWFTEVFAQLSPAVALQWRHQDGERIAAGSTLVTLDGPARAVLTGERTALNFLQTLSATATAASRYVDAVAGTGCTILDTRKTLPGLRLAQKYATRCGGAQNHRIGLLRHGADQGEPYCRSRFDRGRHPCCPRAATGHPGRD